MPKKKVFRKKIIKTNAPKRCYFCVDEKEPNFADVAVLNRFVTERAKIIPSVRSGLCTKHQRRVGISIKHARHLALLPFVAKI